MPQYSNRYTPALQYEPQNNDEFNKRLSEIVAQRQQRYDIGQEMLGKYQEQLANLQIASPDRPFIERQLGKDIEDINNMIKTKYAGDYGNIGAIQRELASRRSYYTPAMQRYQEEQKYAPMLTKLEAEKKLIMNNDPRKQSIYNQESGKFEKMPEYKFYERPDYDKLINEGVVQGINKTAKEYGLTGSGVEGLLKAVKVGGLNAISDPELKSRIASYTTNFLAQTPFLQDPEMQQYHQNPNQFILESTLRQAGRSSDNQYMQDPLADDRMRAKQAAAKAASDAMYKADQFETQPARQNVAVEPKSSVEEAMNSTPFSWAKLYNKTIGAIDKSATKLPEKSKAYGSPYTYATTDEGKKEMPFLLDVLGGVTGSKNPALKKQSNESPEEWHKRVDESYKNELDRVSNISFTEAKLSPKEQTSATENLLGRKLGSGEKATVVPNSDLDNYTYTVIDKHGKTNTYNSKEFFDDYIDKNEFVAKSNIDGYTFADQGNAWRVKNAEKPDDKIYINRTPDNQRSRLMSPYNNLLKVKHQPGARSEVQPITFEDGVSRNVLSANVYNKNKRKFENIMVLADENGNPILKNDQYISVPEERLLNLSAQTDPWIKLNRWGYTEDQGQFIKEK